MLVADKGQLGEAMIVAYDNRGLIRFRHPFPRFSGGLPTWNSGGLTQWMAVPLAGDGKTQIYASLRRTVMHTDESVSLDPLTEKESWWQNDLDKRACGGEPVAIAQGPAGGCAIVGQYPDIHYVLDGRTGKPIALTSMPHKDIGGWTAYSSPILADFNGDGALEALTGSCVYTLALFTLDGKVLWHTEYLDGTSQQVGVRMNAGRVEIGAVAYRGGFRCYAGKDGALLWSFKPPRNPSTGVVTCDIDGDGEEEFIFGAGKTLYALGSKGSEPVLKWQLDLPKNVYSPICADVGGDGSSKVLCLCADGNLYCIGQAAAGG